MKVVAANYAIANLSSAPFCFASHAFSTFASQRGGVILISARPVEEQVAYAPILIIRRYL